MKKPIMTLFLLINSLVILAQPTSQMEKWYIGPNVADMTTPQPTTLPITAINGGAAPSTAVQVANGFYDAGGNMLFYITDDKVFDYNNVLIGTIPNNGTEIAIVPFGNNNPCQNKYNIFTTAGGQNSFISLYQSILDLKNFDLKTLPPIDEFPFITEFGAIAVGKEVSGGNRYLYFLAGTGASGPTGQIDKLIIQNDGTVITPVFPFKQLYPNPTIGVINQNTGPKVFARELDISPDGRWLAWASYEQTSVTYPRYHFIHLDNSGDFDQNILPLGDAYQEFNINSALYNANHSGFRGVEFWQDASGKTRLFMGAGTDGIFYNEIKIPFTNSPFPVSNSSDIIEANCYGLSQIELANNGFMYAGSGNTTFNIGGFDPGSNFPTITTGITGNSFYLANLPTASYALLGNPASTLYTLPDQIDGQDYSQITPSPVTQVVTANTLNFPDNNNTNQTATWVYGPNTTDNPLGATTPVYIIKELRLRQNSHLSIGSGAGGMTFKFSPAAKVIIEQGSSLTLDNGSILTSDYSSECPLNHYTWQGVEVWGNSNLSQIPNSNQGHLIIKGGSEISHAKWGARNWNPTNSNKTGGIISVYNGSFLNNLVDVEFKPYQNFYPSASFPKSDYSSFNECTFSTTNNYLFTNPPVHAYLQECNGLKFIDCKFINAQTNITNPVNCGIGIKSIDATFGVSPSCILISPNGCMPGNAPLSVFENLHKGIYATSTGKGRPFIMENSMFEENIYGVNAYSISSMIARKCSVMVGGNATGVTANTGIGLGNCSGYTIEENMFGKSINFQSGVTMYGLSVANSGPADNVVYKNTFIELNYANLAYRINRDNSSAIAQMTHGLQYLCNENVNNAVDFYTGTPVSSYKGVRLNQGDNTNAAGNVFSSGAIINFDNATSLVLNYHFSAGMAPGIASNVITIPVNNPNPCTTHIDNPAETALTLQQTTALINTFDSTETAFNSLLYAYQQMIDGGSTNALLNQIQSNWSQNVWTLRAELLALSPYITQNVLRSVAFQNQLPQAMFLEICLANPDATKDVDFLKYLKYEIPNPFPQYILELIEAGWNQQTTRTIMEGYLAHFSNLMQASYQKLLNDNYYKVYLKSDSLFMLTDTNDYMANIRYWLNRNYSLTSKYELIENYFEHYDTISADNLLDSIPVYFNLSEDQLMSYNDYVIFYNFRKSVFQSGRKLWELTPAEIATLTNFSLQEKTQAVQFAQNALCFYYDLCQPDEEDFPESGNRTAISNETETEKAGSIAAIPNPAKTIATFVYTIPFSDENLKVCINDIAGRIVKQLEVKEKTGQLIWDLSNINAGIYFYTLLSDKRIIAKGKLAVEK